jgi:hypothetical protein
MGIIYSNFDEKVMSSKDWLFDIIGKGTLPFAVCDYTALISLFTSDILWEAIHKYQKQNVEFFLLCDADVKIILKDQPLLKRYGIEEESLLDKIFNRYNTAVSEKVVFTCPDETIEEPRDYGYLIKNPQAAYYSRFVRNRLKACLLANLVLDSPKSVRIDPPGSENNYTNQTKDSKYTVLLTDGRLIYLPVGNLGIMENKKQSPSETVQSPRFKICSTPLFLLLFLHQRIITASDLPLIVEQLKPLGWNDKELLPDYAIGSDRVALRSHVAPCIYHHKNNSNTCGKLPPHPDWCLEITTLIDRHVP